MRVECLTIEEFLVNLRSANNVFENTVRVSVTETPLGKDPRHSVQFDIVLQASAVVIASEEGQYILEAGVYCGKDVRDAEPSLEGTNRAAEIKKQIEEVVEERAFRLMPGIIRL